MGDGGIADCVAFCDRSVSFRLHSYEGRLGNITLVDGAVVFLNPRRAFHCLAVFLTLVTVEKNAFGRDAEDE